MQSIELIRRNLEQSRDRVLARVEEMREHAFVPATRHGGASTIWVLGHLAYIEGLLVHGFLRGEENPRADWEAVFDGADVSSQAEDYPPFEEVLAACRDSRASTLAFLAPLTEDDLDRPCAKVPEGFEDTFGTYRRCLQFAADHWYMHRGQLADARRSAGLDRMWV